MIDYEFTPPSEPQAREVGHMHPSLRRLMLGAVMAMVTFYMLAMADGVIRMDWMP